MAYDWTAIKREWAAGRYHFVRSFALSLKTDERFIGNAPSHVMISRRKAADIAEWEAKPAETRGAKPWEQNLSDAIRERAESQLAIIGVPDAENLSETQLIETAAAGQVALVLRQQVRLMQMQKRLDRACAEYDKYMDDLDRQRRTFARPISLDDQEQVGTIFYRLTQALKVLTELEREVYRIDAKAAGVNPGPGEPGTDDVRKRATTTRDRAEALISVLRSAGYGPGADPAREADRGDDAGGASAL